MYTAIILGGGPAGCQCALWLNMLGLSPIIIEQRQQLGGLQASSPYPNNWMIGNMDLTGKEFAAHMQQHIERQNVPVRFNQQIKACHFKQNRFEIEMIESSSASYFAEYLVIATGVKPRHANFTESDAIIIGPGSRIFNYNFANKRVAILGGGDNAFENYAFVKNKQALCCHLYARTIRARKSFRSMVAVEDVFSFPYAINQTALTVSHENKTRQYDVFLVLYGWEANLPTVFALQEEKLLDENGFIATDKQCLTRIPNVFAIGEIANRMHPCVTTAMADGVVAAKAIQQLKEKLA